MNSLLDLTSLPSALQASLQRHLPCEASRRRATLAPWLAMHGDVVLQHTWPWEPLKRFWREAEAAHVRTQFDVFLRSKVNPLEQQARSIFDPSLPFYPCACVSAEQTLHSPWPEVFSDAEFWALTMQLYGGDPSHAQEVLQGWVLRESAHGRLVGKSLSTAERRHLLRKIWSLETERRLNHFA